MNLIGRIGIVCGICCWPLLSLGQWSNPCRMDPDSVKPLIRTADSLLTRYEWMPDIRMEVGEIDSTRIILITQDGCQRLHIKYSFLMNPLLVREGDGFWLEELEGFMFAVYGDSPAYRRLVQPFLLQFEDYFGLHGFNRKFNFPLGTHNFICEVQHVPGRVARFEIEQITYLFREKIKLPPDR